jgi:phage shock protein PspC (stress-responsive transcriptional regulator)
MSSIAVGAEPFDPNIDGARAWFLLRGLSRRRDEQMIGGVAGALARRFKVKPLVARVLLLLVTLTGWGLAIYLALWYLMPLEA